MNASKKVITLTEDRIDFLRFDVEWDIFDQLQDFINLSKSDNIIPHHEGGLRASDIIETMQKGLDKRNNLIAASMVFDTLNNPQ